MWVKLLSGYEGKNKNSNIWTSSYSMGKKSKLGVYRALGANQSVLPFKNAGKYTK